MVVSLMKTLSSLRNSVWSPEHMLVQTANKLTDFNTGLIYNKGLRLCIKVEVVLLINLQLIKLPVFD